MKLPLRRRTFPQRPAQPFVAVCLDTQLLVNATSTLAARFKDALPVPPVSRVRGLY